MKQIQVNNYFNTGISSTYNSIVSIEIENKPFGGGNFGDVYNCISINRNPIDIPQVIKIYKESFPGAANTNAKTIVRLQQKFANLNENLKSANSNIYIEYPAFKGIPQFSFEGILDGKRVKGFSSDNLTRQGFDEFEKVLSNPDLLNKFYDIPVERKIYFAFQLASAFKKLDEFKYIHADLKEGAIFLNLRTHELAIIDYDSGVITENVRDKPSTWGAIGDWVAPEIYEQLGRAKHGEKINVDLFTDRWSVAIGINYLISGIHPTFFLKNQGNFYYPLYFDNNNKWPSADIKAPYMKEGCGTVYKQYLDFLNTNIPPQIKEKMANTINFGYKNPAARTSYHEWQVVLRSIQKPPKIKFLTVSETEILLGDNVVFAWSAENAISVEIETIGLFGSIDKKSFKPTKTKTFKIVFKGYYGEVVEQREVKVIPAPKFITLITDAPKIKSGSSANLQWEIENGSKVFLYGIGKNPVEISSKGTQNVKPDKTTTYKFEVFALNGKARKEEFLTVEVFEEGKILFFNADRQFVFPTIPVVLSWEVQNALKVDIEGLGEFQLSDKTIVQPTIDTIYKLKVTDNFGEITQKIQIKILPLPIIKKLLIKTPIIKSNIIVSISTPVFESNLETLPKTIQFNDISYNINVDTTVLEKGVNIQEVNFEIIKIPFLKRVRALFYLLKSEFITETNQRYVAKK